MERLDEVVVGPGAKAADLLLDLLLRGQHDDRHVALAALVGPDPLGDAVAVELGQADVEQDQPGLVGRPELQRLQAVARDRDRVARLLERVLQQALDIRLVVDDQDLRHPFPLDGRADRVGHSPAPAPKPFLM